MTLLVVGELNPDLVCEALQEPRFGQVEQLSTNVLTLGSSAAITACAAAAHGAPVTLVSVVGDDALGEFCGEELAARGVAARVRVAAGRTGSSVVLVLPGGDRAILTDLGVMTELTAHDVRAALDVDVRWLHVCSWFLHPRLTPDLPELLRAARSRGVRTSVDPNYDPAGGWGSALPDALPAVDLLVANEQELIGLAGACGLRVTDARQAARGLLERMPEDAAVVVKEGPAGATWVSREVCGRVAAPKVEVVDTVGAGDTLAGTLVAALLAGTAPDAALPQAVAAATLSTTAVGGVGVRPDRAAMASVAAGLAWQA